MAEIGKRNLVSIVREAPPGLYLNGGELGEVLLPRKYIPQNIKPKDKLEVFIYLDSEDRLVATTETPYVMASQFANLKVVGVNPKVGVFLDWGLEKDLLLPFSEQGRQLRAGQWTIVAVYVDPKTHRIVASTKLKRHLSPDFPVYRQGQPVDLLIVRQTPLGYEAIIENSHLGLLFQDQLTLPLKIGERMRGFIKQVKENGKIDLTLDASGYKRVAPIQLQIIKALEEEGGRLHLDDESSPEEIRRAFGVSKKAFKQAIGALYKKRRIQFTKPGIELLDNS